MADKTPQEKRQEFLSGPGAVFRILAFFFGIVAVFCTFWACTILGAMGFKPLITYIHLDGYRPATFTIEKLIFGRDGDAQQSHATGTVDGQAEEFDFGAYLQETPTSQFELEQLFSVGQELAVYYNPEVPNTTDTSRLLYPTENFKEYWPQKLKSTLRFGFLPLGVALGLSILAGFAGRSWVGVKFAIATLFWPIVFGGLGVGLTHLLG